MNTIKNSLSLKTALNDEYQTIRLILGDQLNADHSWYKHRNSQTLYVILELKQELEYCQHHIQKVCAFFASMNHFAYALSSRGHHVLYLDLDATSSFSDLPSTLIHLIDTFKAKEFNYQHPDEFRLRQQMALFTTKLEKRNRIVESESYSTEHFFLNEEEMTSYFKKAVTQNGALYKMMSIKLLNARGAAIRW